MFTRNELIDPPKAIRDENDRLINLLFSSNEDDDFDYMNFINENASEEYKQWSKEKDIFDAECLKKGIIYN